MQFARARARNWPLSGPKRSSIMSIVTMIIREQVLVRDRRNATESRVMPLAQFHVKARDKRGYFNLNAF